MTALLQDVQFALRMFLRRPGFALVAILTLGLGIGANTAIFSVVHAVVFQPLPYKEPAQLVRLYTAFPSMKLDKFPFSVPEFLDLERDATSYARIGGWELGDASLAGGGEPVKVPAAYVTGGLLETIGVAPAAGRLFGDDATRPGAPPVVVLAHGVWQGTFGGDPALVGKTIRLDGVPTEVVGVMPRHFDFPDREIGAWVPLTIDPANPGNRSGHDLSLVARLKGVVRLEQARAELDTLVARSAAEQPRHPLDPKRHPLLLAGLHDEIVGEARPRMLTLLGAVGFVLLIACANVANLLLARAETRRREVAVRTALGAGRPRLIRQFLTESLILSLAGAALGLVLGRWALSLILALDPEAIPRVQEIGIDPTVLFFTMALGIVTGLLFGLAPALHAGVENLQAALRSSGQRTTAGREQQMFRGALVIGEVALAVTLVVGSGLMIRSFWTLLQVKPGFEAEGLVTLELTLPQAVYPEDQVVGLYETIADRLRSTPGVSAASFMSGLPPNRPINANDIAFEGMARSKDGPIWNVDYWQIVADGYFATMKIPAVEGRLLTEADAFGAPLVAVVNEAMAQKFWPGQSPVGRRVKVGSDSSPWLTVVGVARDVKQQGLSAPVGTEIYLPMGQLRTSAGFVARSLYVVARTAGADPAALVPSIRDAIRSVDPGLPMAHVRTMREVFHAEMARPRFLMTLLVVFAGVALLLAAIGIYGVLSYTVAQRTNEIGIRMALGADRGVVLRMVVAQGMSLAGAGVGLGLVGSMAVARLMQGLLFGVAPHDPGTFTLVAALLGGVALASCGIPALRAVRVDPMVALRYE